MSESFEYILYFFIVLVGLLATVLYWVGRYLFNTDDESASLNISDSENSKKIPKDEAPTSVNND